MPFWVEKGSRAALEGAAREQGGAAREHAWRRLFWLPVLEGAQHKGA